MRLFGTIMKIAAVSVLGLWFIVAALSVVLPIVLKVVPLAIVGFILYKLVRSLRGGSRRITTPPEYAQDYYHYNGQTGPEPNPVFTQDTYQNPYQNPHQNPYQNPYQDDFDKEYYSNYDIDHENLDDYFSYGFPQSKDKN